MDDIGKVSCFAHPGSDIGSGLAGTGNGDRMKCFRWMVWMLAVWMGGLLGTVQAAKPWQTLKGCRLVDCPTNDGDSFKVHWNDGELTIRLYFADTPESNYRYLDRVRAQAAYFGITEDQAVEVGQMAREFTRRMLEDGFSVRTRWQGVFGGAGASRRYGIVTVTDGDLAELLVANGLARIHGMGIRGKTWAEVKRLKALEKQARNEGRGAWGMHSS